MAVLLSRDGGARLDRSHWWPLTLAQLDTGHEQALVSDVCGLMRMCAFADQQINVNSRMSELALLVPN